MSLLTWGNRYSVGVKAIDDGHAALIGMLNNLHAAMMRGMAEEMMPSLLHKLSHYTRHHISAEEVLLKDSGFQGLAQHHARHQNLINQIREFTARHEGGDSEAPIHLARFLRDWISTHIQLEDMEYKAWLLEHGFH